MARTKPIEPDSAPASDKTEQILQGAMQEFLTHGYAGTSMDKVAKTAGVSKATVYSRFEDKEGLFVALVQGLAREKVNFIILDEEPAVALRFVATTLLEQVTQEPEFLNFVRLVIAESGRFPQLAQTFVRNLAKPGIDRLTQYLASHPELKLPDPEATARIFIGSLVYFQLTQHMMHGQDIIPMERDRLIDGLLHLILPPQSNS
ncbi:TetR/AcrR family transcriptional regulator [Microcoleus sp. Pol11C3]|uniref:TetR/AcrR family transcriptional regulator n=1 Tax=Microcoleus sp. Pol11C3 TaxID=3055390 RepID=UPI002FD5D9BD